MRRHGTAVLGAALNGAAKAFGMSGAGGKLRHLLSVEKDGLRVVSGRIVEFVCKDCKSADHNADVLLLWSSRLTVHGDLVTGLGCRARSLDRELRVGSSAGKCVCEDFPVGRVVVLGDGLDEIAI